MLADLGTLGHVAQSAEAQVGAAVDRDQRLAAHGVLLEPALQAGDAERARRFDHDATVLEDVLDRGADLVRAHEHDLVDDLARESERLVADATHRDSVRERADVVERDGFARVQRLRHARGLERLDADDPHLGIALFHVRADAAD